jgi:dipeptidyl aminopeptidase/acylaminoacyl peptidase
MRLSLLNGGLAALSACALLATPAFAQAVKYQTPPAPIPQILDAAPTPQVSLSRDKRTLAIYGREGLPSIAAMSAPMLRLGGHRINPRTNGQAEGRMNWLNALSFEDIETGKTRTVDLPQGARFTQGRWSPDGKILAFAMEAPNGLELWVADAATGKARKLFGPRLNATFGAAFEWMPDSSGVLAYATVEGRGPAPVEDQTPAGPLVQESLGKAGAVRTFEDLLTSPYDDQLFAYYFSGQLVRVGLDGAARNIGAAGLIEDYAVSPDGRWILVNRLKAPFSHLVPSARFPTEIAVMDFDGREARRLADRPAAESMSSAFDAVVAGPRDIDWRSDAPATLVWAEAQDGGEPGKKVAMHDRLVMQDAPFTAEPRTLLDLPDRFSGLTWGRGDFAMVTGRWWKTRHERRIAVNPDHPDAGRVLLERNYQDQFADPGRPMLEANAAGYAVMQFARDGKSVFLTGPGASPTGEHPSLSRMAVADGKVTAVWKGPDAWYDLPVALLDPDGKRLLTRNESAAEPPNYFVQQVGGKAKQITAFKDPAPQFAAVTKQLVSYQRADGVQLSGTLYLPAGYDAKRDGPLPLLMWAYPTEFTDAKVAGQVIDRTANRFTRPTGISPLFLLTQGYAVLDGPSMPIIGANGAEPNDTYVQQLVADAQAAVDKVVAMGVTDRDHIAVGGHSYGAFMTANLLAHSDLFRAGIARSGAYNRTLTPFGFQAEQRTYWQATDVYTEMSPFTFATKIKAPILLIHGGADDNDGTFPIQSERFYAALKGNGATVRYVVLPSEPHGYRGRESTFQTQWEMVTWLDRWVKHAPARQPKP